MKFAENSADDYVRHILSTTDLSVKKLKVLIDCANGSASATAKDLFTRLNVDFDLLHCEPDGCNINENCGSTHIDKLCDTVKSGGYNLGVAFDGDADRCLAVDENGKIVDGDKLIAIISKYMRDKGILKKDTAVVTVMSNLGFHTYMKNNSLSTVCTAVGDRYVLEEMLKSGYNIGGEQSGHIIFLDHATTGDGQLTAVQLINLMSETKTPLSALTAGIEDYPQLLLNVKITEQSKGKWNKNDAILAVIKEAESAMGADGRILVRESGTEPLVRVMLEGKSKENVEYWTNKIVDVVKEQLC